MDSALLPKEKVVKIFSHHREQIGSKIHFAAHSHHPWPDVSKDGQMQYWMDSSRLIDDKWEYIFTEIIPKFQKKVAQMLNIHNELQIAIAPNTHELVCRLLSTFELGRPIKILSTQNEFHSFRRQTQRMEEGGLATVTRLQADELAVDRASFIAKVKSELSEGAYDLFFMSQVFFDSGIMLTADEILDITHSAPASTVICIDGYHSFAAVPLDLSQLEGRIFFISGGYKYAQAGAGVCFMVVPKGTWRPVNTGWMADMGHLATSSSSEGVYYSSDGSAFLGSTQDPSGFYRFNAVWDSYAALSIDVASIHAHVVALQELFLAGLAPTLFAQYQLLNAAQPRGHFLTFDLLTPDNCAAVHDQLKGRGVLTDYRGQRLRIGFGMYQGAEDVAQLLRAARLVSDEEVKVEQVQVDMDAAIAALRAHIARLPSYNTQTSASGVNALGDIVHAFQRHNSSSGDNSSCSHTDDSSNSNPNLTSYTPSVTQQLLYFSLLKWLFHAWYCFETVVLENTKIDPTTLPSALLAEIHALSLLLHRQPVLVYEDYIVLNVQPQPEHLVGSGDSSDSSSGGSSSGGSVVMAPLYTFTTLSDENWFIQVHQFVEMHLAQPLRALYALPALLNKLANSHIDVTNNSNNILSGNSCHSRSLSHLPAGTVTATLNSLTAAMTLCSTSIVRMIESCAPAAFVDVIRKYFAKIPKRYFAEGTVGVFAGMSGAQASFEPIIDAFLGIKFPTPDLFEFNSYMPPLDRELVAFLTALRVRDFIALGMQKDAETAAVGVAATVGAAVGAAVVVGVDEVVVDVVVGAVDALGLDSLESENCDYCSGEVPHSRAHSTETPSLPMVPTLLVPPTTTLPAATVGGADVSHASSDDVAAAVAKAVANAVAKAAEVAEVVEAVRAYDNCVDAVAVFREAHIAFISDYIPGLQGSGGSSGLKHLRDRITDTLAMKFSQQ